MIALIQFIPLDTRPVKKHWIEISEQTPMEIIESVGIQYYSYDTKYDRKL